MTAWLLCLLLVPVVLPALALAGLTLAGVRRKLPASVAVPGSVAGGRPPVAVLVPAHNESAHVLPTIACLLPQMRPGDRLLVVADNCSDDTAELARRAGATVIERHNQTERGKGYALAFGVDWLRAQPPAVVMVVDADCTASAHAVDVAAAAVAQHGTPVQLLNLMHAAPGAGRRHRMLAFAMLMKNQIRPQGAQRLGAGCHLMGTGMALPWGLVAHAQLATGHVAEDMKLGVDLALAGHVTRFVAEAEVASAFPEQSADAHTQKARWEHGHLATLGEHLPRLLASAWRQRRWSLLVLALDLMIPPLALYTLVLCAAWAASVAAALLWPVWQPAAALASVGALALLVSVVLAWWCHGRHLLQARELLTAPAYALWKLPIYLAYALKKRSGWVRAAR